MPEPAETRPLDTSTRIDRLISAIDEILSRQVNAIIHHPAFRRLEASWRQLQMLVLLKRDNSPVIIRVFSASWKEIVRDAERASEFDQSKLFNLIYSQEFDMPGGQPFGLIVADYEISAGINKVFGTDDIGALDSIAGVAAAAFSPVIVGASPELLDVDEFAELDRELDMAYLRNMETNVRWRRLRSNSDARFIGVTCPRVLVRPPYRHNDISRKDGFCFHEEVASNGSTLVWGNSAYALAMVVMREFMTSGWFADIRGTRYADDAGGLVDMYPTVSFPTDKHGFASQAPVEIRLTTMQEQMLSEFGLIPLMPLPYSVDLVFNTNQSLHLPARYDTEIANQNARIAAMLQYVLCACRFAHYLKLIMREHVGEVSTVDTLRSQLNQWLAQYCIGNEDADTFTKARYPLRSAHIDVREIVGKPGVYACVMHLQPHFQLDDVTASFQLLADMNNKADTARGATT
ncbi:type VI secretion system contractile sheath large subunit [Mesorhizobium retamae]|uniref:Type VI secretion system contractile sheath large subunit n=1 Tax=Mesorhizobium retamae TaxID=2912854 RepID=A0ABS9QB45_9HYPH|nr:type VI secretion system contractile sheath large subunit [Mesorhizobium sp. IRAMC:0171]MCG7504051.1 type VI secretion system contractile sheath large subunit [Mesorhizobium sp. IRAMC:0171]